MILCLNGRKVPMVIGIQNHNAMPNEIGLLKPDEIEYLAFEGGGGKGNAFLGAVLGLEKEGVLQYQEGRILKPVRGIAGASAGAITALFLASGYSYLDLRNDIFSVNFNDFFDSPKVGDIIVAGNGKLKSRGQLNRIARFNEWYNNSRFAKVIFYNAKQVEKGLMGFANILVSKFADNRDLTNKLLAGDNLRNYINCFQNDFGIFSGIKIHAFFNQKITEKIALIDPKIKKSDWVRKWWTFKEHYDYFNIDLKFTSVNMRTENLYVLSKDTTPNLPVATAARMSMSLPFIFKPVVINQESIRRGKINSHLEGLWVDGGLFNNAPINLFDTDKKILFRLGNRLANNELDDIFDFLLDYFVMGVMGNAGSGQINEFTVRNYLAHVIELNIEGTSLLKFNLSDSILERLIDRNSKNVEGYFKGKSIP